MHSLKRTDTQTSHSSRNTNDTFFKPRVQAKLAVGRPGDQYEVEADRTADSVVDRLKDNTYRLSRLKMNGTKKLPSGQKGFGNM